jgi:radical SAM protein with 4Fe4S-binding SPASM domain
VNALRAAKEEGLETQLDITLTDRNWKEIDGFVEFGAGLGVRAANFFFLVCTGRAMKTTLSTENYDSALRQITTVSARERRLMVRARCAPHIYRMLHQGGFPVSTGTRGCLAGRSYMGIGPEGNVSSCPYMSLSVGNIKEQSLTDLWENSPILNQLRQGVYHGRCSVCEYKEICGGCRARALAINNDLLGEDPLCTYEPSGKDTVILSDGLPTDIV